MNHKPRFSNEAGASGVNFTQPSRSAQYISPGLRPASLVSTCTI